MEYELIIAEFNKQSLPKENWTHQAHLVVAVWYVLNYGREQSEVLLKEKISSYNLSLGGKNTDREGYHHSITCAWLAVVDLYLSKNKGTFSELCDRVTREEFTKYHHPLNFYSKELLESSKARLEWVKPDLNSFKLHS